MPVWESVVPTKVATFHLGEGRTFRSTVGGEIATYFCRPDGIVYDLLPGLQSPETTRRAILEAIKLARTGPSDPAIREYHRQALEQRIALTGGAVTEAARAAHRRIAALMESPDPGTRFMTEMAQTKMAAGGQRRPPRAPSPRLETIVVVETGGLPLYRQRIHEAFLEAPLRTPREWKEPVFHDILGVPIEGGEFHFDIDTAEPER